MDGLDLLSVVHHVMHHLHNHNNKQCSVCYDTVQSYIPASPHLAVHQPVCDLTHLGQDGQRVGESVLSPGLRLVPAELALHMKRKRKDLATC